MRRSALQPGQHALVSGRERRSPHALAAGGRSGPGERRDLGFPRAPALWRAAEGKEEERYRRGTRDRKSTRLNSSHLVISYAVFCLKKKTKTTECTTQTIPLTPLAHRI